MNPSVQDTVSETPPRTPPGRKDGTPLSVRPGVPGCSREGSVDRPTRSGHSADKGRPTALGFRRRTLKNRLGVFAGYDGQALRAAGYASSRAAGPFTHNSIIRPSVIVFTSYPYASARPINAARTAGVYGLTGTLSPASRHV